MKRIVIALLIALLGWSAFAGGVVETLEEPDRLTLIIGTPDIPISVLGPPPVSYSKLYGEYIGPEFTRQTGIPVDIIDKGSASGNAEKIRLLLNSGESVDVYADYMGRLSEFANPNYAVDLTKLLPRSYFDGFHQTLLAQYRVGDSIYALPDSAWATAMFINVELADQVGMSYLYERGSWSTEEFTEFCRAIRGLGDEYYGSVFLAKQSTGDYFLLSFLAGFDATIFDLEGNLVADSPNMIQAFEYLLSLQSEDLIVPGTSGIPDSEYRRRWNEGKIGAASGLYSFALQGFPAAVMDFPRAPGSTGPTVIMGNDGALVFQAPTGRLRSAELAAFLVSPEIQQFRSEAQYRFASRPGVKGSDTDLYRSISALIERSGIINAGLTLPKYNRVREAWYPMVQAIFSGMKSPAEAMAVYVQDVAPYVE